MQILTAYKDAEEISEVLVVTLENIQIKNKPEKIKIIHMPKDSDLGLLSRYTFALSCKNRYVFIQDDDWVYDPKILIKCFNKQEPLVGCHPRWFYDDQYQKKPKLETDKAPILLTCGVMVDTWYLPAVIQDAKIFWENYQNCFNGEDIFMSRAIAKASGQDEFKYFLEGYKPLDMSNPLWQKNDNKRTEITNKIYNYFK